MTRHQQFGGTIAALVACSLVSCIDSAPRTSIGSPNEAILISAAASTNDVLEALSKDFSATSGSEVKVNAGPSNSLANQILAGAPADLFLSASQQWADEVERNGQSHETVRLLTNELVIVVPEGNPGDVHEPTDLLSPKVKNIAIAGEKVPAGIYAEQALTKLGLWQPLTEANKVARGQDVRSSLSFVGRGEAEAGIVYSTDARIAPAVTTVHEFDASLHDEIAYVLVLLKHGSDRRAAREFYEFLQSAKAEETYRKFGFARLR